MNHMIVSEKAVDSMNDELSELREKVAQFEYERDELQQTETRLLEKLDGANKCCGQWIDKHDQVKRDLSIAIAAAQAVIERQREALELFAEYEAACEERDDSGAMIAYAECAEAIKEALALPANLDALHEALAKELLSVANEIKCAVPPSGFACEGITIINTRAAAHRARKSK